MPFLFSGAVDAGLGDMTYNQGNKLKSAIMPKPKLEVISIEADAAVPDVCGLERLMEEVNILELEGYYFSPNRKAALTKKAPTFKEITSQPVTLLLSPYGQPGELAYKVLQATFFKLTSQGSETDGVVQFSRRELAQLVGKSFGGTQSEQLFRALMQLRNTGVTCTVHNKVKQGEKWVRTSETLNFSIFSKALYEGSARGKFACCVIQVEPVIVANLRSRHVSYFNFERMQGLDMVGMMLYKRFFRHLANIYREGMDKSRLVLEKDYAQVCTTWLGLKPTGKRVLIERQLGKRLEALKACRLLRECRVEERKDGEGFKIVAFAGSGFFADYDNIYRRRLPASTPVLHDPEPLVYLHDFHKQLGRDQEEFKPKEVAFARDLLDRYGDKGVRSLMAYGLAEARSTNFDMQWFGALSVYEGRWQAQERKQAKAGQSQAAIAACPVCNEDGMLEYEDGSVGRCPHELSRITLIQSHKPIRGFHQA